MSGASVLSVIDSRQVHTDPDPAWPLDTGQTLVLMGTAEQLVLACHFLDQGPEGSPVRSVPPAMEGTP